MHTAHTILAHASAPGFSRRAIIRVSGGGVAAVCERLLMGVGPEDVGQVARRRGTCKATLSLPAMPLLVRARSTGEGLPPTTLNLPVLVTRFRAPASFTGEDVLEIQLPGNPHLIERMIEAMLSIADQGLHIRLAHAGEFTARAYFNRKLTLEQAEGVAATIAARTGEQLRASKLLLSGETGHRYRALADECATLLALVESGIDFTDQDDVVPIAPVALAARLRALHALISTHLGGAVSRESATALPVVAIVGRPNAGKSTLFNALLGRARAVASPVAGTTRDVLAEPLDLSKEAPGTGQIMLLDLPGLDPAFMASAPPPTHSRGAGVPPASPSAISSLPFLVEQASRLLPSPDRLAQQAAHDAIGRADAILWCDPSGRFDSDPAFDTLGVSRDQLARTPIVRVRTFGDRVGFPSRGDLPRNAITLCALDGWNLPMLRRALADAACSASAGQLAALLPRHRLALSRASTLVTEAIHAIDPAGRSLANPELIGDALRAALDQLGELVGHISPDDVLGRVFATFCVGK